MPQPSKPIPPIDLAALGAPARGLHIVATPIGNLGDITLRALATLAGADVIYCEDTRQTRKLLTRYGLTARLAAYHDHNAAEIRPRILAALEAGATIALVSDAGTPLISDPGFKLVREAAAAGYPITAEPGPSAALAALTLSALPTDRFFFVGFLPAKPAARRKEIALLDEIDASLVLFEAPSRLGATLQDLSAGLGERDGALLRELTKLHEEARRGALETLARQVAEEGAPKGEIVLVVGPPKARALAPGDLDAALRDALARHSLKSAVAQVCTSLALPRRLVYARAIELSQEEG